MTKRFMTNPEEFSAATSLPSLSAAPLASAASPSHDDTPQPETVTVVKTGEGRSALSRSDLAMLEHTQRFRLSTPESLARRLFRGDADAATANACRLVQEGYLTVHALGTALGYFAPTARGRAQSTDTSTGGADPALGGRSRDAASGECPVRAASKGDPVLTGRELAQAYGTLAFCTSGPRPRERVMPSEIAASFSDVAPLLRLRLDFFVGEGEAGFGVCLVDAAGQDPLRLTRKVADFIHRLLAAESIAGFHKNGRFAFALVTADAATTRAVKSELRRWRLPLRPLIVTLPSLAQFGPAGGPDVLRLP